MASVGKYKAKDGRTYTRILFVDPADGRRRTIRLGRANKEQTTTVKGMIERLVKSRATGTPDAVAGAWLAGLPDRGYAKLAKAGLAEPRVAPEPKLEPEPEPEHHLGDFLAAYVGGRTDIKSGTAVVLGHTVRNLLDFFGADKPLGQITEGDADAWRLSLIAQGLAVATVCRRSGVAKQFFKAAVRRRLITTNPFGDLDSRVRGNKERQRFINRQDAQKVLDACPDAQWRAIFALCRYGGLRCPSEVLRLRWNDIDWERGRFTVHSVKTEHHPGHESRVVPLFPELREPLMQVFEEAEPGTEYVITRYRLNNLNLRQQFGRILQRAGLHWPKPFQNLRSTRETELCDQFPEHVVTAWIGNSQATAREHYLQVRDEHFERAIRGPTNANGAAHRTAQSGAESGRKGSQSASGADRANGVLPADTANCELQRVGAESKSGPTRIRTLDQGIMSPLLYR